MKKWNPTSRIILLSCAILLVSAICVTGTLAIFTAIPPAAHNDFSIGDVKIDLNEESWIDENPMIEKNDTVEKDPTVYNDSDVPVWVRITAAGLHNFTVENLGGANGKWEEFPENSGVWYYYKILEPGETTEPLFSAVTLDNDVIDPRELDIVIYTEAVQTWVNYPSDSEEEYAKNAKEAFWVLDGNEDEID